MPRQRHHGVVAQAVEALGLESVYLGRHKVTETDFVGVVTRLKNSGCEVLFIGTIVTDTIQLYTAARKAGWDVPIVGNMVVQHPLIAGAADGGMEGLYSSSPIFTPDYKSLLDEDEFLLQPTKASIHPRTRSRR